MGTEAGLFLLVIIAAVGMLVYFAPCLVASRRNHRNAMPGEARLPGNPNRETMHVL